MTTATTAAVPAAAGTRARRALTAPAAALAALVTWALAVPVLDVDLAVRQGGTETTVAAPAVAAAAVVAALAGWALLAVLERAVRRPRTAWTAVAGVVLVLSLGAPLGSGVGGGAQAVLALLHVVVGAVVVAGLRPTARR
ncbi:hypothetical protein D5H78_01030 [Vallicoccus soli]|uniref:Uncharacterized protein n=2 Tax=Vallicoccus soli TaxID=2339232 RepID=A0A3A3Z8T7_9ACTN|nr:hypothetical protein D5H78_01030 [Vallicoccus soli]